MKPTTTLQHTRTIELEELGNTDEALAEFILQGDASSSTELDELAAAQMTKSTDVLSIPLIITLIQDERRTSYRRGDVACNLANGSLPKDGVWVEVDLRTGLKKAIEQYGKDLLAFEKVYAVTTLNVAGIEIRKKQMQAIRVLVRNPATTIN